MPIVFCPSSILTIHLVSSNSSRNHLKLKYCVHLIDTPHLIKMTCFTLTYAAQRECIFFQNTFYSNHLLLHKSKHPRRIYFFQHTFLLKSLVFYINLSIPGRIHFLFNIHFIQITRFHIILCSQGRTHIFSIYILFKSLVFTLT